VRERLNSSNRSIHDVNSSFDGSSSNRSELNFSKSQKKNDYIPFGFDFGRTEIVPNSGRNKILQDDFRSKMESSFNEDFSNIEIVKSSRVAKQMNTTAFTQGNKIHFAPGAFNSTSKNGKKIISHELAHVKQQRQGRVKNRYSGVDATNSEDFKLENEAIKFAEKANAGESLNLSRSSKASSTFSTSSPVQFYTKIKGKKYDRVSDDGKMAVDDHTRNAWAESSNIAKSNKVLDKLNSKAKIKILPAKLAVPHPKNSKAKPRNLVKFQMLDRVTKKEVDLSNDCGYACLEMLGANAAGYKSFVAANKRGTTDEFTSPSRYKWDYGLPGGTVSTTEKMSGEIYIRIMRRQYRKKLSRIDAIKKWSGLPDKTKEKLSKKYGINKYANPKIGQGIAIGSERDDPKATFGGYHFHFALSLLTSGSDYISLEDFSRSGVLYYFKMYGPPSKKQSFAEEPSNVSALGNRTTTMVVQHPESIKGEVNTNKVHLKRDPAEKALIGKLVRGVKVKIIRKGISWMKVEVLSGKLKGKQGWIMNKYFLDS